MFNKKYSYGLLLSAITMSLPAVAGMERDLRDAIENNKYIFSGKISDVKPSIEGKEWTFEMKGKKYFIQKGRPNEICPNGDCTSWKNFVAKLTTGPNAKIDYESSAKFALDDNADYTVFVKKTKTGKHKKSEHEKEVKFTKEQEQLLDAIKKADFKIITAMLDGKDSSKLRTKPFIKVLLSNVWDKDYNIKMAASYAFGLMSKEKKFDKYIYDILGQASDEANYRYRTRPIISGHCLSAIRQYGIYDVADGLKKGFVVATRIGGDDHGAIYRRTMDEDFFILSGEGEFWTKDANVEKGPFKVSGGDFILNPSGMHIQFRSLSDRPLRMIVTTYPPYDHVIKKWPEDEEREIHETVGFWKFEKVYDGVKAKLQALAKESMENIKKILENKDAKLLDRVYAAKLFPNEFIQEKLKIVNDEKENWAIRVAVIESLKDNKLKEIQENLKILKEKVSGFVKKAIEKIVK